MAELHIYRGIQGSGKTTLARELSSKDGGRVVGRDHLRRLMGFEGLGSKKQEDEVTLIQTRLIHEGLKAGQNVHVDDMNLKAIYVKRLMGIAAYFEAEMIVHDLSHVDLTTCLERNRQRSGQAKVNDSVVFNNYQRFVAPNNGLPLPVPSVPEFDTRYMPYEPYKSPKNVSHVGFLVDIDGTIANHEGIRGHHDYHLVSQDEPKHDVIAVVRAMMSDGFEPIFVSGRPDSCRVDTETWISQHVFYRENYRDEFKLFMRRTGDHRADYLVKYELFDKHIRKNYLVACAFDDRDQVVNMYREIGLTVLQVAPGNF
jgi:predicted kinase